MGLSGCTTLKVNKFGAEESNREGIAYFLPFSQFETKLTWTASCDTKNGDELKLTPKAEMTPKTGQDPDGLYVIDYKSLDAFTKTSDVKVSFYDNGAIKSINASADDKTGEILGTTLTAVGKFVRILGAGAAEGAPPEPLRCSVALKASLTAVKEAKSGKKDANGNFVIDADGNPIEGVDQKTAKLKAATDRLEAYSAVITSAGASITDAQRAEHFTRISAVSAAQIELDIAKKKLAGALKKVTFVKAIKFPSRSSLTESASGEMVPVSTLRKWVKAPKDLCAKNDQTCLDAANKRDLNNELKQLAADYSLWFKLAANSDFADRFTGTDDEKAERGIRYRISVPATLKVCGELKCSELEKLQSSDDDATIPGADPTESNKEYFVKAFPVQMMNQGTTLFLPFKSAAFTNATLSATFAQNGTLTSAGYEQKRATGEAVASLAGTLLGEVGTTIEKAREDDKTELELIQEQTALAKAQKELADAEAALVEKEVDPDDAALEALQTDTALREAEVANINAAIAKIEANNRLDEAQNPE